jgi:hypothetical protein
MKTIAHRNYSIRLRLRERVASSNNQYNPTLDEDSSMQHVHGHSAFTSQSQRRLDNSRRSSKLLTNLLMKMPR